MSINDVHMDITAWMVPTYKEKGDVYECSNSIGISLLSVICLLWLGGIRIQPTFDLVRVVRGD